MSEATPARIRIACVDDSADTRALFGLMLRNDVDVEVVARLDHTRDLASCLAACRPTVVVLDLWMPGQDSLEAMHKARSQFPEVRFLILSSDDDPAQVERAFRNGASGYVVKNGEFDRLRVAIRTVAGGGTVRPTGGARGRFT